MIKICCNPNCCWAGDESECVTPHHEPEHLLCPDCYEVVEDAKEEDDPYPVGGYPTVASLIESNVINPWKWSL